MKLRSHALVTAIVFLVAGLYTTPAKAHADTYRFVNLGPAYTPAGLISVYGITDSGAVVTIQNLHVGVPQCAISHLCTQYETYVNGIMVNKSPTAPNLVYDNGTPCAPTVSFAASILGSGVCNNGHEVYEALPTGAAQPGAFDGPNLADAFAYFPIRVDQVHLNASGDFAFDIFHPTGALEGQLHEAIDLSTTPEPGSILLLGTGCLAAAKFRHRLFQRKAS